MNLDEKIINALKDLNYEEATDIQKKAIPIALKKYSSVIRVEIKIEL